MSVAEESPPFGIVFGRAMRALRERQGLSQGQLAHRAQPYLSRATVNRMELGQVNTTDETITIVLEALGLSMADLIKELGDTRVKDKGRRRRSLDVPIQHPLAALTG